MTNEKNILLEFICDNFHMTKEEGEQAILDGKYSLLDKSSLRELISEVLDYDSWNEVQRFYFNWDKYIKDMEYNGEIIELVSWPFSQFVLIR